MSFIEKCMEVARNGSFRRWVMAIFSVVVLVFGGKLGIEMTPEQRNGLIAFVLGLLGFSNAKEVMMAKVKAAGVAAKPEGINR